MGILYAGFIGFVLLLLALDLGVFHRTAHVITVREALKWSALWISIGLAFSGFIYVAYDHHWFGLGSGAHAADGYHAFGSYLTGFVVEKALAVDNIFVIAMLFTLLRVPPIHQHRVLFWGIVGALLMRGLMIGVGAALIAQFTWILYVFGAFLLITGIKMLVTHDDHEVKESFLVRTVRRILPVTDELHGSAFFVRLANGARRGTPLLLALVLVELSDVLFAVDSIPAVFAVTTDPFLVFTSNVFAILGLRSLFFALAGMMERFKYLGTALAIVLIVIGVKMLAHDFLHELLGAHFNLYMLGVIAAILAVGVTASLVSTRET